MGLFENSHADATQLGAALHQGLVTQQEGLAVEARIVQQYGVDGAGPFHGFLEQGNGHVHAPVTQGFGDLEGAVVQAFEVPWDIGDTVFCTVFFCPVGGYDDVASIEILCGLDRVQGSAQQCDIALVRVLLHRAPPCGRRVCGLAGVVRQPVEQPTIQNRGGDLESKPATARARPQSTGCSTGRRRACWNMAERCGVTRYQETKKGPEGPCKTMDDGIRSCTALPDRRCAGCQRSWR